MDISASNRIGGNIINFFYHPVKLGYESKKLGRDVIEEKVFVRVDVPGGKSVFTRRVKLDAEGVYADKPEWQEKYVRFVETNENPIEGTDVRNWPEIDSDWAYRLKGSKVHTVEQLAELSDSSLQSIGMGVRELQNKAKAWLEIQKERASAVQWAKEKAELEARIKALESGNTSETEEKDSKKGRGRPKFKPTEEQREEVKKLVSEGTPVSTISAVVGVSVNKLYEHFSEELKKDGE
jgi:hypothetical protein